MDNLISNNILFEHRFWLQILGDHSRFIISSSPITEKDIIEKATYFKELFDKLLEESKHNLASEEFINFTTLCLKSAKEIRNFKLDILSRQILGKITLNLTPTFVNHMVNEVEEYISILNHYLNNSSYDKGSIHQHLLWLSDGIGHTDFISSSLDMTEKDLIKLSRDYGKVFHNLYDKSIEFYGYMRTELKDFPALKELDETANAAMNRFKGFLEDLKILISSKKVLGLLNELTPDHMFREECYYQTKLSQVSNIKSPNCDPGRPRVKV